jgi:hypothetical protein
MFGLPRKSGPSGPRKLSEIIVGFSPGGRCSSADRLFQQAAKRWATLVRPSGAGLWVAMVAATMMLSACGGGSSSGSQNIVTLSGDWQFTVAAPADGSFSGGLQGGFLLQNNSAVTGGAAYSVSLPQAATPCNSGSASITGTISKQTVNLTATAGTQTFTLTGTLSFDGSTMAGTYASTAGTAADGTPCGTAQAGLQWNATLVPPLTGGILGSFHSTGGSTGLMNQDFAVSGDLTQAANTGASSASLTGTLSFLNPATNLSDYPCFTLATVNGQISGNSVTLQLLGKDGSTLGQIGEPASSSAATGVNPVTFDSAQGGYIVHGGGPSYLVATTTCPGSLTSTTTAGDFGNICLALGSATGCQEAVTLTPASLTFPAQAAGATSTQTITLTNAWGATLNGLTLALTNNQAGAPNYTETDTCGVGGAPSLGQAFSLLSGQSCTIKVTLSPQCGTQCSSPLTATLTVNSPQSTDGDTVFTAPITGSVSGGAAVASVIDFAVEGP